jgi:hypothetical protein
MFEIKKSVNNQYYFVLKATNGQILVTSETYTSLQSAQHAVTVVRSLAPAARVVGP